MIANIFKYLLFIVFLIIAGNSFSQSPEIDSLQIALKNCKTEDDKRMTELYLAKAYTFIDPAKTIELATEVKKYFILKKDSTNLINTLNTLGISYSISGDWRNSEAAFLEKLDLGKKMKDSTTIAGTFSSLGNVYHTVSQYKKSIKCYLEAERIFKKLKNKEGLSTVYSNLGNAYKANGDYETALDTYFKALKLGEEVNKSNQGTTLSNIGNVFADMGNIPKAKEYFNKSVKEFEKVGNSYYVAWGKSNLASAYFDDGDYDMSEKIYLEAFVIHEEQNDQEGIAHVNHTLGNIEYKRKNYFDAREKYQVSAKGYEDLEMFFEAAKVYIDWGTLESETGNKSLASKFYQKAYKEVDYFAYDFELAELYQVMAESSKWNGDYKRALEFYEKHAEVRDSVYKMETTRAFANKETKYLMDKKQKEIKLLKQEQKIKDLNQQKENQENLQKQKRAQLFILFSLIGAALLSVVVVVLIRSNKMKQQTNKLLQSQNEEISHQKEIIEEKNKDITDSINYAQNIQQAILPDLATAKNILGDSFILFQPRDIVSGDFYWMHKLEDGDVFFAVADCTGHGVPGAFMSMMGNDMLNKIIIDHGISDPGKALSELNNEVKKALAKNISADKMRDGMDITLCKMTKDRTSIFYSSAMRSVYHISGENFNEEKGDKNPIGGNTEFNYAFTTKQFKVIKGDSLYLTTDGYADQFGGLEGKKFMSKNLKEIFLKSKSQTMDEQYYLLKENFSKWKGTFEQVDDVTVLGIRI